MALRGMFTDKCLRLLLMGIYASSAQPPGRGDPASLLENEMMMKTQARLVFAVGLTAALTLTGCAGMSSSERATATGAVVGGAAGGVISGSAAGAAVGAAVGGVVGHQVDKKKNK
jgi:osmotically inducible lipoprotein OsmB